MNDLEKKMAAKIENREKLFVAEPDNCHYHVQWS